MKYLSLIILSSVVSLMACNGSNKSEESEANEQNDAIYSLTPFTESYNYPDATLSNMDFSTGQFTFEVSGDNYQLGTQTPDADSKMCANSAEGQHIHLIVDNEPYSAQYTNSFQYEIEDGEHYILAFLSRSYHESLKHRSANILKKVTVDDNSITSSEDVTEPILTYSRPKGTYVGRDTEKVMLDFYLSNVNLTDGYTVEAKINDEIHMIDKWQPYYVEGLPVGDNSISLTLLKDGAKVETALNPVTRTFTLKADPLEEN